MKFEFSIRGIDDLQKRLEDINEDVQVNLSKTAQLIALDAEAQLKRKLSEPGSGNWYVRQKGAVFATGKGIHIASRAGEPPAPDTGRLRASATAKKDVFKQIKSVLFGGPIEHEIVIKVGGRLADYAKFLEFGTSKIAPRPFFGVTIRKNVFKWVKWWQDSVAKGFKGT